MIQARELLAKDTVHDANTPKDRSIPELFADLSKELTTLVRQELELARTEISRKGADAARYAALFGVAALLAVGAFVALTMALVAAIALALPMWAAALVVAMLYAAGAAAAAIVGVKKLKAIDPVPQRAVANVKRDVETIREAFENGR